MVWTAQPATFPAALDRIASRVVAEQFERLIESSVLEWTFLRPGVFACNSTHWWSDQLRAGDLLRWPYLASKPDEARKELAGVMNLGMAPATSISAVIEKLLGARNAAQG